MEYWAASGDVEIEPRNFFQQMLVCWEFVLLNTATYYSRFFTNINLFNLDNDFRR